ncbi:MAG: HNH endonuclease [Thaumarchaeota archaeon]|nr:HNH endonuclease [Nitrososphaerota archaeon]
MPKTASSKQRIAAYLKAHVGEVVTSKDIQRASGGVVEFARRVRELRDDEGWQIHTHNDDDALKPGEYCLTEHPPDAAYHFSKGIPANVRAFVLERNGYTCQMCGAGAGEKDDRGRKIRLHIGHIVDKIHGGDVDATNLRALCNQCNQGAKNQVPEPPRYVWLLSQVRRARVDDQRAILEWLKSRFNEN